MKIIIFIKRVCKLAFQASLIIFIIIITVINTPTFAQETIDSSKLHPAHPFYFLKTVRESLEMGSAQTTRVKYLRQLEFATRRLRETKTLILIDQNLIPPTLERYIAHLNTLPDKHKKTDEFAAILRDNLTIHLKVLEQVYQSAANARAKMAIRSAMNRVIQRADVPQEARLPICYLFNREASSSALNQIEQVVLKGRAKKCFSSLNDYTKL